MRGVNVSMIVRGQSVRKIRHQGKTYLPVNDGDVFTLKVDNSTNERIVAIVSVDGLSIMDAQPASHNDKGYIVDAHQSVEICGFRRGLSHSKEFVVTTGSGQSYAEKRTGSAANRGVIGVVIKPERRVRRIVPTFNKNKYDPWSDRERSPYTLSAMSSAGTAMGQEQFDPVTEVAFRADDNRKSVIVLYYDTVESLRRKGIDIVDTSGPNPFPAEESHLYCPDA